MIARTALFLVTALLAGAAGRAEPLPPVRAVILVLVPGLSLADVRGMRADAALGVMPTRSDGTDALAPYRVLATGTRSPAPNGEDLGRTLRAAGVATSALGGDAARVLAGEPSAAGEDPPWRVRRAEAPFGWATDPDALASAVGRTRNAERGRPLFLAVLFDDLARADAYAPRCLPAAAAEQRRDALRRLDRFVAALVGQNAADVLLVAPEPSAAAWARRERLGPVLFFPRNGAPPALLTSPSTRGAPGLVANTDVAATIAALLSVPEEKQRIGAGEPMETRPAPGGEPPSDYLARRVAAWSAQAREQRLLVGVPWALAGILLAMAAAGAGTRRGALLGLWGASVPLALLLAAPLALEAEGRAWAIYAIAFVLSLIPPLLARFFAPRRVLVGLCTATTLTIALDGLLGFPLLGRSPFSYSPIEAARFYGIGNEAAGALLGASLIAAAATGRPVAAAITGALVAVALGHPRLGADFGGLIAAAVGFAALVAALRGGRVSRRQAAIAVVLGAILIGGFVAWEASRGARSQTHVGRAVARARERGGGALLEIARRKAAVGARLLVTSPWSALLAAEIAAGVWLLRRSGAPLAGKDAAALRALAWGGAAVLLVNDSGVVAAAACGLFGCSGVGCYPTPDTS